MNQTKNGLWNSPLLRSQVTSEDVRPPEMLFGYLIGPFGALLASGSFYQPAAKLPDQRAEAGPRIF